MPMIKEGIERITKNSYPVELYRPSHAVSFGASIYAWGYRKKDSNRNEQRKNPRRKNHGSSTVTSQESNTLLKQRANYSYGIRYLNPVRKEYIVRYLVNYRADLPAEGSMYLNNEFSDMYIDIR